MTNKWHLKYIYIENDMKTVAKHLYDFGITETLIYSVVKQIAKCMPYVNMYYLH